MLFRTKSISQGRYLFLCALFFILTVAGLPATGQTDGSRKWDGQTMKKPENLHLKPIELVLPEDGKQLPNYGNTSNRNNNHQFLGFKWRRPTNISDPIKYKFFFFEIGSVQKSIEQAFEENELFETSAFDDFNVRNNPYPPFTDPIIYSFSLSDPAWHKDYKSFNPIGKKYAWYVEAYAEKFDEKVHWIGDKLVARSPIWVFSFPSDLAMGGDNNSIDTTKMDALRNSLETNKIDISGSFKSSAFTWPAGLPDPKFEWMSIMDPDEIKPYELSSMIEVAGFVVSPWDPKKISGKDVPFVHPFGFDWELCIAPDPQYYNLLTSTNLPQEVNTGPYGMDSEYGEFSASAKKANIFMPKGCLGMEIDNGLLPEWYRPLDGDRVGMLGKWIIDAGHSDFHTEIHQPVLIGSTSKNVSSIQSLFRQLPPLKKGATLSKFISPPFHPSQRMEPDNATLIARVAEEIARIAKDASAIKRKCLEGCASGWNLAGSVFSGGASGTACALACVINDADLNKVAPLQAHPKIINPPYSGNSRTVKYTVQLAEPRECHLDQLKYRFNFVTRSGVEVDLKKNGKDKIDVLITLGKLKAASLPNRKDDTWTSARLKQMEKGDGFGTFWETLTDLKAYAGVYEAFVDPSGPGDLMKVIAAMEFVKIVGKVLEKGIVTDIYDAPQPISQYDDRVFGGDLDKIDGTTWNYNSKGPNEPYKSNAGKPYSVDDSQPFPVYGWLTLGWEHRQHKHAQIAFGGKTLRDLPLPPPGHPKPSGYSPAIDKQKLSEFGLGTF